MSEASTIPEVRELRPHRNPPAGPFSSRFQLFDTQTGQFIGGIAQVDVKVGPFGVRVDPKVYLTPDGGKVLRKVAGTVQDEG